MAMTAPTNTTFDVRFSWGRFGVALGSDVGFFVGKSVDVSSGVVAGVSNGEVVDEGDRFVVGVGVGNGATVKCSVFSIES